MQGVPSADRAGEQYVTSAEVRCEHRVDARGSVALQRMSNMAIGVHRQTDLAVAEDLHNDAWVDSLRDQQRGAGMPQVVEPQMWQPSALRARSPCATKHRGA